VLSVRSARSDFQASISNQFLVNSLSSFPGLKQIEDNSTLAAMCLALDYQRALDAFGVTA
jgi:hypothetical protein